MKKIVLALVVVFCITGCNRYDGMQLKYNEYVRELRNVTSSSEYIPCDIEITYDRVTDDEVSYQVIIDNPKEVMRNIDVVVSHNMETKDGYPSIGVFDEESINLDKGIILVGYFKYIGDLNDLDAEFRVSISYVNEAIEEKTIYFIQSI